MELVTLALGSPHGRFFCANVAYKCSTDARAAGFNRPQTTADAREVIEGVDISAIWELSEMDLLEALAYDADLVRAWQPPNDDVKFADPHVVAALRPIAAAALSSEHTTRWGEPVDVDNPRLVVHAMSPVEWRKGILANETQFRERRTADLDSEVAGEWWSIAISLSDNEGSTLLGGWDPDATFWLNPDVVDIDDEPALWP